MNEEKKAKRDEVWSKWKSIKEIEGDDKRLCSNFSPSDMRSICNYSFDAGFALAMEEAKVLVECLKAVENYLYFMGDELTGDDLIGDGALTKRYNEKLNLIAQALKEFKAKVGE